MRGVQAAPVEHLQLGLLRPQAPGAVLLQARLDPTLALRCVRKHGNVQSAHACRQGGWLRTCVELGFLL